MPSLRDIRNRIGSVRSTRQITKAMKMVSAAKLRRAQDAVLKTRPYAVLLDQTLSRLAARAAAEEQVAHPLLAPRAQRTAEVVVVTSDRGLAGGFNSNICRFVQRFLTENADRFERIALSTVGKKGREYFKARRLDIRKDYTGVHANLAYEKAEALAREATERYLAGEVDAVFLAYNEFKSAISQKQVVVQLLPIDTSAAGADATGIDFKYEPSREALLAELLPRHVAMQVWRALLESAASEHGARMSAMESATKNAEEMIASLSLQYNRARQAYVTKELMEIVGGAEALK
ncbi:ATP synthase F1, gamma subunit [Anaeromyxobacter dehalogenans 2CP-1]|uniref:ATP synthase gamma chain n=1 Tax=Anaeromyxobacter dehalogenans (strain ATCC BAA-258 / DSM 21875 / 2CP-1) TaxID=455488 RepID=ATPG_ANAD2|nr:ATP synthase F1 subunit gamma [Anaeromyxobacter dehalogenans]B8JCV1.1 RecName: Full=ATP synthase gamma chain; AltName: Full=ATP synthase F1 sector gamma subunit; AltName: Full=F-ATPase gamma subunit [Anaeromyxobacter dehalogenans 2CP-1]ACL67821.1 ATP synthase F1, gamma subunit [Anaeromyxobacter dehalogenans 2CP-1]